jgi:hypothetical protein
MGTHRSRHVEEVGNFGDGRCGGFLCHSTILAQGVGHPRGES